MKLIDKIRKNITTINFNSLYNKYFKSGEIKPFDENFYLNLIVNIIMDFQYTITRPIL